jgi:beta-barrel assembly-enhancing protease
MNRSMSCRRGRLILPALLGLGLAAGSASAAMSRAEEIRLGQQAAAQVERQHRTWEDPTVSRIGRAVASRSDAPNLPYRFRVIDQDDVNAFALPGGPVYVTDALLRMVGNDRAQLAGVLGHEVAHIARRHSVRQIERQSWIGIGIGLLTKGDTRKLASVAANFQMLHYSRDQEYDADRNGVRYARAADYDPMGMARFLDRLASMEGRGATISWLRSHPGSRARADRVRQMLGRREAVDRTES